MSQHNEDRPTPYLPDPTPTPSVNGLSNLPGSNLPSSLPLSQLPGLGHVMKLIIFRIILIIIYCEYILY